MVNEINYNKKIRITKKNKKINVKYYKLMYE